MSLSKPESTSFDSKVQSTYEDCKKRFPGRFLTPNCYPDWLAAGIKKHNKDVNDEKCKDKFKLEQAEKVFKDRIMPYCPKFVRPECKTLEDVAEYRQMSAYKQEVFDHLRKTFNEYVKDFAWELVDIVFFHEQHDPRADFLTAPTARNEVAKWAKEVKMPPIENFSDEKTNKWLLDLWNPPKQRPLPRGSKRRLAFDEQTDEQGRPKQLKAEIPRGLLRRTKMKSVNTVYGTELVSTEDVVLKENEVVCDLFHLAKKNENLIPEGYTARKDTPFVLEARDGSKCRFIDTKLIDSKGNEVDFILSADLIQKEINENK
jgi:hypothetical protein